MAYSGYIESDRRNLFGRLVYQAVCLVKVVWLGFWLAFATVLVAVPIIIAGYFSSTGNFAFNLARVWAWIILKAAGVKLIVTGKEKIDKKVTYIIISNHQSHFDGPVVAAGLGIQFRWVAKQELLKIPVFGNALYACGNIFIDRKDREKSIRMIKEGMNRLSPGTGVMFFAEGTRSEDGKIGAFKKGGFAAAIETGYQILPVAINGSNRVLPKGSIVFSSNPIEVRVGDPIETSNYSQDTIEKLAEKTRDIIISMQRNIGA
ncbi:MAG: 1-acyl-sn-glycerol-3-phosphate acyltransferase [Deltaproteobacteria bacterium]|nr:1-acyl-sn-glycerol-3-phosphate acyltransferase [Deltaproteobacteria bacterium]